MREKFYKDNFIVYTLLFAVILAGLHAWQYVKSGFLINPLINLIMVVIYIPVAIVFRRKCLPLYLMIYGFILLPYERFGDLTSLFMVLCGIALNSKFKYCIYAYIVEIISCYILNGLAISNFVIEIIYVLFFLTFFLIVQNNHATKKDPLYLKDDEKKILELILSGKEIKEITEFSQNTVYKKLRDARERNDCFTNEELITRYKAEK